MAARPGGPVARGHHTDRTLRGASMSADPTHKSVLSNGMRVITEAMPSVRTA